MADTGTWNILRRGGKYVVTLFKELANQIDTLEGDLVRLGEVQVHHQGSQASVSVATDMPLEQFAERVEKILYPEKKFAAALG